MELQEKKVSPIKIKLTREGKYYINKDEPGNKQRKKSNPNEDYYYIGDKQRKHSKKWRYSSELNIIDSSSLEESVVGISEPAVQELKIAEKKDSKRNTQDLMISDQNNSPEVIIISDDDNESSISKTEMLLLKSRADLETALEEDLLRAHRRFIKIKWQVNDLSELLFVLISAENVCSVRIRESEKICDELMKKEKTIAQDKYESTILVYGKRFADKFTQLEEKVLNTQKNPHFTYCHLLYELHTSVKNFPSTFDITIKDVKKMIVLLLKKYNCGAGACNVYEEDEEVFKQIFASSSECFLNRNYKEFGLYGPSHPSTFYRMSTMFFPSVSEELQSQKTIGLHPVGPKPFLPSGQVEP